MRGFAANQRESAAIAKPPSCVVTGAPPLIFAISDEAAAAVSPPVGAAYVRASSFSASSRSAESRFSFAAGVSPRFAEGLPISASADFLSPEAA